MRHWSVRIALVAVLTGILVAIGPPPSTSAPTVDGWEWRELFETTGLVVAGRGGVSHVVMPTVTGRPATAGGYRSDVFVSWTVTDIESPVSPSPRGRP